MRAAGDVACQAPYVVTDTRCRHAEVAQLLSPADWVLALGDLQYQTGLFDEFMASYDPTWGAFKAKTKPTPGNHEYETANAAGYRQYFGLDPAAPTWYSFNTGAWHIVSLDSECELVGGCGPTSPQGRWLAADLRANTKRCILAFWHKPRWSSGVNGNFITTAPLWNALYARGADIVLSGHDHDYERFNKKKPNGAWGATGIRQFVVGTGGHSHHAFRPTPVPGSQRRANAFGVLHLDLQATRYSWRFVSESGTFTDTGSTACN